MSTQMIFSIVVAVVMVIVSIQFILGNMYIRDRRDFPKYWLLMESLLNLVVRFVVLAAIVALWVKYG